MIVLTFDSTDFQKLVEQSISKVLGNNSLPNKQQSDTAEPNGLLNKKEAAKLIGVCSSTVDNYRRTGELKSYQIGSARRFKRADVLDFIEQRKK